MTDANNQIVLKLFVVFKFYHLKLENQIRLVGDNRIL